MIDGGAIRGNPRQAKKEGIMIRVIIADDIRELTNSFVPNSDKRIFRGNT